MIDKPRFVVIGGGSGLATLLRGLKNFPISLSAVVTMTDNGQSSGRLSREMGILPPGDVRKCLAALSNDEQLLTKLFEYRFSRGRGLSGHSLGNLLLLALADITGDFESAIRASSKILAIKGEVIPSTLEHVSLIGELKNGTRALGEVDTAIQGHRFGIKKVSIIPEQAHAHPMALHFIRNADAIIVGPGSLFTSIVPNFLIPDLRKAFEESPARKYYVCNASTERGETEGFSVEDHIRTLREYVNGTRFDAALVNNNIVTTNGKEGKLGTIRNITTDQTTINDIPVVLTDLINEQTPLYHDSRKLSQALWQLFTGEITVSPR